MSDSAENDVCPTPGCDGDVRYAAPGRGHRTGCTHPLPPEQLLAEIEKGQQLGGHQPSDEALETARQILAGEVDAADAKAALIRLYTRALPPAKPPLGHALVLRMEVPMCECGIVLGGHEGTAKDWHAQHLAEHVFPPDGRQS